MHRHHRITVAVLLTTSLLAGSSAYLAARDKKAKAPATALDDNQRILHALDRFTFGTTPGQADQVRAMGLDKWFEQQLHPESIKDDLSDAKLAGFRTLKMSTREIASNYPTPQMIRQIAQGKLGMPLFDSEKRAIYEAAVERYRQREAAKKQNVDGAQNNDDEKMLVNADTTSTQQKKAAARISPEERTAGRADRDSFLSRSSDDRYKMILNLPDGERMAMFRALSQDERQQVFAEFTPRQREEVIALTGNPAAVVTTELLQAKLLRETYSNRQLEEVMTDFWLNHFNIFINKGQERYLLTSYERDVIRPHALGKFKDLLLATAKSPAMLFYLDNAESIGPDSDSARNGGRRPPRQNARFRSPARFGSNPRFGGITFPRPMPQTKPQAKKLSGLNENYAREVMELHTLGVDGGYSQQDVTQLAKVLTGWTITPPKTGDATFEYRPEWHEPGEKIVLGKRFKDDGEKEGLKALDMLAHSPATAHFISRKIAMRFVADDPPQTLVASMAQTFLHTDGDIREVLRTMYKSPEFWSKDAYRAKVKTPLEFVVSGLRATGADVTNAQPLAQQLNKMGMPLYGMQPPTGYAMKADAWVNSAALLARFNFSLALASGKIPGVTINPQTLVPADGNSLGTLEARVLGGELSAQTHATIERELEDPTFAARANTAANDAATNSRLSDDEALATSGQAMRPRKIVNIRPGTPTRDALAIGLILGSPEFQRR